MAVDLVVKGSRLVSPSGVLDAGVAVKDGVAQVRLGGGCQGCAGAQATMSDGVAAQIKAEVPEIEAVVDITDHASGTNPYQ